MAGEPHVTSSDLASVHTARACTKTVRDLRERLEDAACGITPQGGCTVALVHDPDKA